MNVLDRIAAVSYTHLDVYKRQDVVSLIHQSGELQPLVLSGKAVEFVLDILADLCRSVIGLLGKGQHDAVFPVDLRVEVVGIVADKDIRHIFQVDLPYAVHAGIKEEQILCLFFCGNLVAYADQIFDPVLLDIACRHGEVLSLQDA